MCQGAGHREGAALEFSQSCYCFLLQAFKNRQLVEFRRRLENLVTGIHFAKDADGVAHVLPSATPYSSMDSVAPDHTLVAPSSYFTAWY